MVAGRRFVRSAAASLVRLTPLAAFAACRDEPTRAVAPFAIEASLSGEPDAIVGTIVTPAPRFVVRNSMGDALANVPVSITITKGNGTLVNAATRTGQAATSVGDWTLGTIAGENAVTIIAGSAPPVNVTVVGLAGPPASVVPGAGALDALAGDLLSSLFTLRVRDRYANPVPGAVIGLAVEKGGGDVSPKSLTTDNNGLASGITWRLGRLGGSQQLIATVGGVRVEISASIRTGFDPGVRVIGATPSPEFMAALTMAVDRLRASVVGDLPDVPVLNFDMSRCGVQAGSINETVDDLIIFAMVTPIDGVGRVLAAAGPCVLRTASRFPVIGIMRFDSDDVQALGSSGRLPAVVLHEMLHVTGIGTLWRTRDMLVGAGGADPRFNGLLAAAQCSANGGLATCSDGRVPVENTGGAGTLETHWRESVFDAELMTGFVESSADMPLSSISIASLEDLGYVVNMLAADPFQIPLPGSVAPRLAPQLLAPWETLLVPLFEIDALGLTRRVLRN